MALKQVDNDIKKKISLPKLVSVNFLMGTVFHH